jgi:hypothetical protein
MTSHSSANSKGPGSKDTIYIDVDDEITAIIDKVRSSSDKIVALVLPKRATVLQSIVNMKLLKRTAEDAKKHLVLITTEAALMPLAGAIGLYVASTPQSKPEIPAGPGESNDDVIDAAEIDDEPEAAYTAENAANRPVGELAWRGASAPAAGGIETLALDNDEDDEVAADADAAAAPRAAKAAKNKKLRIPNFNKFRMLLALGVLALIVLIVGLVFALKVLPKAVITVKTDASDVNSDLDLTLDTKATKLDMSTLTLPAKAAQAQKTQSQQVPATGTKNNGDLAEGSVSVTVKRCAPNIGTPDDISSGTGVSSGGQTYITQESMSFGYNGGGGSCVNYKSNNVDIKAQAAGTKYNVDSATFSVAGHSDMTGTGSADGGTDNIVKVVTQGDIDGATQKISANADTTSLKDELSDDLHSDGWFPLPDTFEANTPTVTSTSKVGDPAENVTVTAIYIYTMYGAKKSDLDSVVKADVESQVDTSKESILVNGVDKATVRVISKTDTSKKITFQAVATIGPDLHIDDLKKQAAGKKTGNVIPMINNLPGVTGVDVKLSPFWVSSVPNNPDKITVVVKKASDKQ